ncbi:MAG: hypothetical protein LBU53_13910 [Zoogloeaceae bacterium]|nr:hypothetical protein [Zoogloeaceae bacterium]
MAEEEKVSMNQFFVTVIAEKVSALKTASYFRKRMARGAHRRSRRCCGNGGGWRGLNRRGVKFEDA